MSIYLRIGEAAQRLGVCKKTIRRWETMGKIHCWRTVGGHRRISILEIARLAHQENDLPKTLFLGGFLALAAIKFQGKR